MGINFSFELSTVNISWKPKGFWDWETDFEMIDIGFSWLGVSIGLHVFWGIK